MRPEDRSARREVSACGTALYGLLPVPATWLWCPQPWPSPAFWHWGGEVQKPQAESRALTRTRCPFQAPRFSCFLLEVLGQACFLSRSDCTEGSIIFASRFTFKKQNVTVCVCVCAFPFLWVLSRMLWLCVKVYEMIYRLFDISQKLTLGNKLNLDLFYD